MLIFYLHFYFQWRSKGDLGECWGWGGSEWHNWKRQVWLSFALCTSFLFSQPKHCQKRFYFKRENWAWKVGVQLGWWQGQKMRESERERHKERPRGRERSLPAKTIDKVKTIINGWFYFLHKNTEVCKEYMLRAAYFFTDGLTLFFAAFCWYWTMLASTWPPWIPVLIQ